MKNKLVLIINEDKVLCEQYAVQLQSRGYNTLIAHTARRGYEIAVESDPDLIYIDAIMAMDTEKFNIIKELQHNESTVHTPIVLIKGLMRQSRVDIEKEVESRGADIADIISVEEGATRAADAAKNR
ncbi:MAG: response regulator [Chitinivibrionales bacterium]|nr:response regulator [Chitinivibrionales bacterium]